MSKKSIIVENISKKYELGARSAYTLRESLSFWTKTNNNKEDFWALRNIDFTVEQGEAVGIIGGNGAGKSTLLKILSRITYPTTGKVELYGRVASLLEVGTGFHPELTGRENIYLNGSLLGMTTTEIKSQLEEIIEFSGVSQHIDTPVKHYSSGMYVRLAFSIAAHLNTEILLVDEVLAVGDLEFRQKCLGKMNTIRNNGKTIIMVSHNLTSISQLCLKTMFIEKGKIECYGSTEQVISSYISRNMVNSHENNDFFRIEQYKSGSEYESFKLHFTSNAIPKLLSLTVRNSYNQKIYLSEYEKNSEYVNVIIPKTSLGQGTFWISLNFKDHITREIKFRFQNILSFTRNKIDPKYSFYKKEDLGILRDEIKWE